jgi:hypothetical protein
MHSRKAFLSAISLVLAISSTVQSKSDDQDLQFTIQVAAFTNIEDAIAFAGKLSRSGESPVWGEVDVPGRGRWVRIFIGLFDSSGEARRYAERLVARALIQEYLVRPSAEMKLLMRPRNIHQSRAARGRDNNILADARPSLEEESILVNVNLSRFPVNMAGISSSLPVAGIHLPSLPIAQPLSLDMAPHSNTHLIPRSNPVRAAFRIIAGDQASNRNSSRSKGGLWLSGDLPEGLARLRWIVGPEHSLLLSLDREGHLRMDMTLLTKLAGAENLSPVAASLVLANYINLNEGLLLLVQMSHGTARYCLHLGNEAPTLSNKIPVSGSINLDNNYDSRINPYRPKFAKLDQERPPSDFDALIALNPAARWFNLRTDRFVSVAQITFHELAEAYAKVAMGLEYLPNNGQEGAHNHALDREEKLKGQRPLDNVVTTFGPNRVLRSEEELRQFYTSGSQR